LIGYRPIILITREKRKVLRKFKNKLRTSASNLAVEIFENKKNDSAYLIFKI